MRRSASEPTLFEVGDEASQHDDVPAWLHSASAVAPAKGLSDCTVPVEWEKLLTSLAHDGGAGASAFMQAELINAAHQSLSQVPLRLKSGAIEEVYLLKQIHQSGPDYSVMEGVEHETQRNFSLKIVSRSASASKRLRAAGPDIDPLHVLYLISTFVDEVFAQPHRVCLCMK